MWKAEPEYASASKLARNKKGVACAPANKAIFEPSLLFIRRLYEEIPNFHINEQTRGLIKLFSEETQD